MTDDVHLLTGAYALDALDDDDRQWFEEHLAGCEPCRREVYSLRAAAVALGEAVAVPPPPSLRHRVLAEISATPQQAPAAPRAVPGLPRRTAAPRPRRTRWPAVAAAAALVLAGGGAAGAGIELVRGRQADQRAARQAERLVAIAGDPAARRVSGAVTGGGSATVFVSGSEAALITTDLPALPADEVYQLWLVRPGAVVSAGLGPGGDSAAGRWSRLLTGVRPGDKVAISVEPTGGSAQPTTTPVTVLQA